MTQSKSSLQLSIDLGVGDPADAAPDLLRREHANWILDPQSSHYSLPHGEPRFIQAIVGYYERDHGVRLNPQMDICVTHGARPALVFALLSLDRLGGPVGYLSPAYVGFEPIIRKARMTPIPISIETWLNGELDIRTLLCGLRGGAFLINNPHNPTGLVMSPDELREIARWAHEYDVRVMSDAVYAELYDGQRPVSMLRYDSCAVEVFSISKTFRACGWRVGAVVGESNWIAKFKSYYEEMNGVPFAAQMTAASALEQMIEVGRFRSEVRARRAVLVEGLRKHGFTVDTTSKNRAGMFVWALLPTRSLSSSVTVATRLAAAGVLVSPGSIFGVGGEGAVRFSLNVETSALHEAIDRIDNTMLR
jgi:aspartate/methionine/tyrosine aminotransferase